MARPILIDTDPGIDDALALLAALASPEVSVEAVTTVAGNVPVETATANALRVLGVAAPPRRPRVARGAPGPLAGLLTTATHYHGEDGLGNVHRLRGPDGRPRYPDAPGAVEARDAADLILEVAGRLAGDLTLVALGPLTNVAIALGRDAARLRRIGRLVVMGGAVAVPGNVTAAAEFNFFVDPEAARAVLEAGLPVDIVPLDATRQAVLAEAALVAHLAGREDRRARFVADITAHAFARGAARQEGGIVLHDPLAVAAAIDPGLVEWQALHVEIECEGRVARGLSLADRRPLPSAERPPANCRVATRVDTARFLPLFLERLCPASR